MSPQPRALESREKRRDSKEREAKSHRPLNMVKISSSRVSHDAARRSGEQRATGTPGRRLGRARKKEVVVHIRSWRTKVQ